MANKVNISFNTILKRKCCLESESKSIVVNVKRDYDIINRLLESIIEGSVNINPSLKINISEFMSKITNSENANRYFREGISIISKLSKLKEMNIVDEGYVNNILDKYIFEIIPYLEDTSILRETAHRYILPDDYRDKIINYAGLYEVADRILLNYKHISNRFNILDEIRKAKYRNLQTIVENCCDMIDTYKVPSYAKFNLCIEEMNYLLEKEGIKYNKSELVQFITEYFLLRSADTSIDELKKYRKVLRENYYITGDDINKVGYLMNQDNVSNEESNSIQKVINNFLLKTNKSENDILDIIHFISNYKYPIDIKNSLHKVFWLIWLIFRKEIFDNEQIKKDMDCVIIPTVLRRLEENDITKSDLQEIIYNLASMNHLIVVSNNDSKDYYENAMWFKDEIDRLTDLIDRLDSITYSDYNIEAINFVNSNTDSIPLSEFKIFKFHNLIKASMEIDKYLKYKAKNVYKKGINGGKKTIAKIKNVLFPECDETLYTSIGEDNKADLCVAQYIYEESDSSYMTKFLDETCYEFNNMLNFSNCESIKCYYIMNPTIAEIHLKESTSIELTEEEKKIVNEKYDNSMDVYIDEFAYMQSCLKELEYYIEDGIIENLLFDLKDKNLTTEQFMLALEALSFLNIDESQIRLFEEGFNKYRYSNAILESAEEELKYSTETKRIEYAVKRWIPVDENNITYDMKVDALNLLEAIMEANIPSAKNNSLPNSNNPEQQKKIEEKKRNPFKGINLTNMKLYLEGLKKKAKDMTSKEKEISRNIDNNFRRLVKAMKDSLVSDRREAIIKGSVIPSFSRCIKICIGLAGLGIATGNPAVPLLTAIGGFAASKNLTKKERILLLDEIETELQVVDKEINMAESKNQMKKYRTLLKYKKDLQRQYQRIRYNVRVGKDILPGSTSGIRNSDE